MTIQSVTYLINKFATFISLKMVDFLGNISRAWTGKLEEGKPKLIAAGTADALVGNEFGHRILDSALIVLRVARTLDMRLQNNADIDDFYRCLISLEKVNFTQRSFENKTVIVLEGLAGSGKSSVAKEIESLAVGAVVLSRHSVSVVAKVEAIFHSLPAPVAAAFEFVINYFIAHLIVMNNEYQLFIVDQYHHALSVDSICAAVPTVDEINVLNSAVFEWPFDLPTPQLVFFLAVSTETRLARLEADGTPEKNAGAADVKDFKENTVYSKICGPTTVGIDASGPLSEVASTIFDAFDYYGTPVVRKEVPPPQAPHHRYSVLPSAHSAGSEALHSQTAQMNTSHMSVSSGGSAEHDPWAVGGRRVSMGVYGVFTKLD